MLDKFKDPSGGLSKLGKVSAVAGAALSLVFIVAAFTSNASQLPNNSEIQTPQEIEQVKGDTAEEQAFAVETKMVTEDVAIPFEKTSVHDATLEQGKTAVKTPGANGTKRITYKVTLTGGQETNKEKVAESIVLAPVTEVTSLGAKVPAPKPVAAPAPSPSNCHASYTGKCVPIASDVDCAGGSGNGPAYVSGPVTVVGVDVYDLDRDGNGLGCE